MIPKRQKGSERKTFNINFPKIYHLFFSHFPFANFQKNHSLESIKFSVVRLCYLCFNRINFHISQIWIQEEIWNCDLIRNYSFPIYIARYIMYAYKSDGRWGSRWCWWCCWWYRIGCGVDGQLFERTPWVVGLLNVMEIL